LTALTEKRVAPNASQLETLAGLDGHARATAIEGCVAVTSSLREGLDLTGEIECLAEPGKGDVVIVREGARIAAFALCHVGAASEAVTGSCYVKFAAVRPGAGGAGLLDGLLDACETLAAEGGADRLEVRVSLARRPESEPVDARGTQT